jgi:DHA1 family tetracycline resistance protein-like MFS transporter
MVLGFFLAIFSLGQLVGAPIIGELADVIGRRKALLLTVFMTFVGLGLTAISMERENLYLLFVARLITGFFAANMTLCLVSLSDLSKNEQEKVENYGHLAMIVGLSFVFGAFIGGKLSDPTLYSGFSPQFPFYLATVLNFLNFLLVLFTFRETALPDKDAKLFQFFTHFIQALKTKNIKMVFALYFLFLFAWTTLFQFIPVMMVRDYFFTSSNIGDLALLMGICWILGSGYLNKILLRFYSSAKILEFCLYAFSVFAFLLIYPVELYYVLGLIAGTLIIASLAWPLCNNLISSMAPRHIQGKILGISQSVQSLSLALAPAVGGIAYQVSQYFPFAIGACATFLAGILYWRLKE